MDAAFTKWMTCVKGGLRAYGQSNPLLEYRFEAYEMFKQMTYFIQDCLKLLFRVKLTMKQQKKARDRFAKRL